MCRCAWHALCKHRYVITRLSVFFFLRAQTTGEETFSQNTLLLLFLALLTWEGKERSRWRKCERGHMISRISAEMEGGGGAGGGGGCDVEEVTEVGHRTNSEGKRGSVHAFLKSHRDFLCLCRSPWGGTLSKPERVDCRALSLVTSASVVTRRTVEQSETTATPLPRLFF